VEPHQRASVYARSDGFYVVSDDRTVAGFYIVGAAIRLDAEADDQTLGSAIVSALDASRDRVPSPARDAPIADSLVSLSPARSWRAFARPAQFVGVAKDDGEIAFEPWRHMPGRSDAFEPVPNGPSERVGSSNLAAISAMARHLLDRATHA
jgi:hypothetical protein